MKSYTRLIGFTTLLTLLLIMLGAFVRLSDAGLGCPDWPGCYGKFTPFQAKAEIDAAVQQQGGVHGPVSHPKAWKEMIHRYIASVLGLLIIGIAILAYRYRKQLNQSPVLPISLVGLVCLQGAFGAWTVTLLLKPAIVTGHLLGGMLILGLLTWLWLRQAAFPITALAPSEHKWLRKLARLSLVAVVIQIALGGWVSTNYAAVVCTDFPTCQGKLWPSMDFEHAFHLIRQLGQTPYGDMLTIENLTAIHVVHRIGALLLTGILGVLIVALWRRPRFQLLAYKLSAVLILQLLMGIGNVVFQLPLWLAVAHNGGAALLLMVLVLINYRVANCNKVAR